MCVITYHKTIVQASVLMIIIYFSLGINGVDGHRCVNHNYLPYVKECVTALLL